MTTKNFDPRMRNPSPAGQTARTPEPANGLVGGKKNPIVDQRDEKAEGVAQLLAKGDIHGIRSAVREEPKLLTSLIGEMKGADFKKRNLIGRVLDKIDAATLIPIFQKAIENDPGFAEAHYNLGYAYSLQRNLGEAVSEIKEAIRLKPDYEAAYNALGKLYFEQGRVDDAIEQFKKALEINPDFEFAKINLRLAGLEKSGSEGELDQLIAESEGMPGYIGGGMGGFRDCSSRRSMGGYRDC